MKTNLNLVESIFPELPAERVELLLRFTNALLEWNTKINLVSRKDTEQFETHHLLSALAIVKGVTFPDGATILDIGTGGGLPGIPLAICFPYCRFHLVDSIGKKIKVVNDIIQQLNLPNVTAEQVRAESLSKRVDFITGRAVSALEPFIALARPSLLKGDFQGVPRGIIYLKGEEIHEELKALKLKAHQLTPLNSWYADPFFAQKFLVHIPSDEILSKRWPRS
jgi:16S rRNA (guanine527-N7)-methyltransferase